MSELEPLIQRAQRGDPQALSELFRRHYGDVTRIVHRLLGPSVWVEDVVQEVFLQLFRALPSFKGTARFSTWMYRVAANVVRMHLRRQASRPRLAFDAERADTERSDLAEPDEALARVERARALYKLLDGLSEKKRTVLVLHDLEGMNASAIAEIVEAPVLTVRTRLFYARREIFAAMAGDPVLATALSEIGVKGAGGTQ